MTLGSSAAQSPAHAPQGACLPERADTGRPRRTSALLPSSLAARLRSERGPFWGLCSYCLRPIGQQRTTRATCASRDPESGRRTLNKFAFLSSGTAQSPALGSCEPSTSVCSVSRASMRSASSVDGLCGARWMEPLGAVR